MGQSAGAISVGCLLGSPLAAGLFRRAVCLSGGPTLVRSPEYAATVTRYLMTRTGCTTADEFRELPMEDLLAAQKWVMTRGDFGAPKFCPTVGGAVLPASRSTAWTSPCRCWSAPPGTRCGCGSCTSRRWGRCRRRRSAAG